MIYRIAKTFSFDASHQLHGLPEGHKCGRLHGHTYSVTVELECVERQLTHPGFLADFGELSPLKKHIDETFDHRHLNDVVDVEPTSENLARIFYNWCTTNLPVYVVRLVRAVRVSETPSTWAEYRVTQ